MFLFTGRPSIYHSHNQLLCFLPFSVSLARSLHPYSKSIGSMTKSDKVPVWIDCDPGNDDVFAIMLALDNPQLDLVGISTSFGNVSLDLTTQNALRLLEFLGSLKIPVYRGSHKPLQGNPPEASNIHGATGIGGTEGYLTTTPKVNVAQDTNYVDAIISAAEKAQGELCVIATGPLTNLEHVLEKVPDFGDHIQYLSIMGGAFGFGNITPYAEFNIYSDPIAAHKVLNNESLHNKIILSPLNLTHKCIATKAIRNGFKGKKGSLFQSISNFYAERYSATSPEGPPVHDPVAVFSLMTILNGKQAEYNYKCWHGSVSVTTEGEKKGQTTFTDTNNGGVYVGYDINPQKFWDAVSAAVATLDYS